MGSCAPPPFAAYAAQFWRCGGTPRNAEHRRKRRAHGPTRLRVRPNPGGCGGIIPPAFFWIIKSTILMQLVLDTRNLGDAALNQRFLRHIPEVQHIRSRRHRASQGVLSRPEGNPLFIAQSPSFMVVRTSLFPKLSDSAGASAAGSCKRQQHRLVCEKNA